MPVASNDSGQGSDSEAEASGDFGPYEPDEDGAAASSDDGYSGCASPGGGQDMWLDGVDVGSGGLGDLLGGLDGGEVGGGQATLNAVACQWSDCQGIDGVLPRNHMVGWTVCKDFNCEVVGYALVADGAQKECGRNTLCQAGITPGGWNYHLVPPPAAAPWLPPVRPAALPRISNAHGYPRTYGSLVACEFGLTLEGLPAIAVANRAPFMFAAMGNDPRALWAFGIAAVTDLGGAWVIRQQCIAAEYGPN